jgi:phenylacetate-CoA ligase
MQFAGRQQADFRAALSLSRWLDTVSDDELRSLQWEALTRIWADCVKDVPYYAGLVSSGLAPAELASWDDFRRLPLLDRHILQERASEFGRLSGRPEESRMTGGSTGVPVRIRVWKRESEPQRVAKLILWQRLGYRPGDRLFLLWGHLHLLGTGLKGRVNHLLRVGKDVVLGYRRANAYALSPEKCAQIARDLIRFRPRGLIGYASALDYFVRMTESFHGEFCRLGLRFVLPAGEMPPQPDSYPLLEQTFRCPVIEEYAGVEIGQVAMRGATGPFRVYDHLNYVETLPSTSGEGEELVLTSLTGRYVPLIRYAPGDLVSGINRLGHGHVREFARVEGRTHDTVSLPGGVVLHSMAVFHCVHQESAVVNIQMALTDSGPRLRLVTKAAFEDECEHRIRRRLSDIAPQLRDVPIDIVADVATTRAGKRRWISDERTDRKKT